MSSWKDNSHVVTAAISVAAALLFAIGIYEQSLIPTRTAGLNNEISEKNKELNEKEKEINGKTEHISNLKKQLSEANQKNTTLATDLKKTKESLAEALNFDVIQHNNPYPKGLGKLRIKDSADSIFDIFPKDQIDITQSGYYSVKLHGFISGITYYFDEEDTRKKITHILVHAQPKIDIDNFNLEKLDLGTDRLQPLLEEAFGKSVQLPLKGYYTWKVSETQVFKDDSQSYIIMEMGFIPGTWPKKLQKFIDTLSYCPVPAAPPT